MNHQLTSIASRASFISCSAPLQARITQMRFPSVQRSSTTGRPSLGSTLRWWLVVAIVTTNSWWLTIKHVVFRRSGSSGVKHFLFSPVNRRAVACAQVPDSMHTLFMSITGGLNWFDAYDPLREVNVVALWLLLLGGVVATVGEKMWVGRRWSPIVTCMASPHR